MKSEAAHSSGSILREAEALGVPWEAILRQEITAERILRDSLADLNDGWPLATVFYLLPNSLLQSWRVRERLDLLSWQAAAEQSKDAARQLRSAYLHLAGKRTAQAPIEFLLDHHLLLGYRRVLELQRIARVAERARGHRDAGVEEVAARTGCSTDDADWAIDRALGPRRSHRLDDAMRRAREEGFELPQARSEPQAFLRLKRLLGRRGLIKPGRPSSKTPAFPRGTPFLSKESRGANPGELAAVPGDRSSAAQWTARSRTARATPETTLAIRS